MTTRPLRILHTSDLHLGDGSGTPGPLRHSPRCLCALDALAEAAAQSASDLVVIAGDVFESARVPDAILGAAAEALSAMCVPVVVLPGNHDHFAEGSLYHRPAWREAAGRVHVIGSESGEWLRFPELGLSLWGRAVHEHSPDHRPLQAVPGRPEGDWFVVVAHGHYLEARELAPGWPRRSSPILPGDLHAINADYVALGHWDVCTRVGDNGLESWYSGAPVLGGKAATVLCASLSPGSQTRVERVPMPSGSDHCSRKV